MTDMQTPLTPPSQRVLRGFARYTRFYLQRHFHAVRVAQDGPAPDVTGPMVIYLNHPAWWDPLIGLLLALECLPQRRHWAVIEQAQLARYRIFAKLGFFGVEPGPRGGRRLLAAAAQLAQEPQGTLWVTPQGRFSDPRERPLQLAPGLGYLAQRLPQAWFVPLALEYPFWQERLPEALARFGEPLRPTDQPQSQPAGYSAVLAARLTATQDRLAAQAIARTPAAFDSLLAGRSGVGGVYDLWRRSRAWLRGERFRAAHGEDAQPPAQPHERKHRYER